jgi:hypothetical protein
MKIHNKNWVHTVYVLRSLYLTNRTWGSGRLGSVRVRSGLPKTRLKPVGFSKPEQKSVGQASWWLECCNHSSNDNKGCVSHTVWPCHLHWKKSMYLKAKEEELWKLNYISPCKNIPNLQNNPLKANQNPSRSYYNSTSGYLWPSDTVKSPGFLKPRETHTKVQSS